MKVFIILAGLLMLGACTGKPEGFVLKGELKGAPDDHWVFLTNTGQTHYYDSTRLKNGRFEFKGKVDGPELRCITYFKDPSQRVFGWDKILNIPVYVENAAIQVTLPFAEMPSKLQKELPAGLQVKGSESHDLYMAYKRRVTPFVLQNDSLFDAYRHVYYYKKGTEEDVFRCVREMDAVRDSIFYTGVGFIRRHISSPVAVYVAKGLNVRAHERRVAREVAGLFPEEFRKTPEGQKLEKAVLGQPLYVGDVLPDFEVLTTGLKKVKLSGILRKGHYTLVELWASWCGPCRADIPHLKETYERYHGKGFDMVSISIDDDTDAWLKAVKEEGMAWTQVCGANGKSYDMPWPWGGNCGVVDFTLPAVADWWGTYQQKPIDDGISGFWTDMGEPAWSNEEQTERLVMKHHLGMHDEIHNVYGLTWDKVVKEQFEKRNPNRRVFQMTRAAYAGLQRYTFGWTGDCGNGDDVLQGWGQLANQIPVILSAGLGVIPFTTCDITGYCGDIEDYPSMAELYTRWIQFGAFNPLSRIHHEGDNPVEPWLFGPEAEKNAKEAIELKYRLLPYIYTYAREAHDTGLPIMRPLFLEYPADMETFSTDGQFLFGQELLVAPVVKKGARTKNVYLPEGTWIDYNNKQTVYTGEQWTTVEAPLSCIPMFVKQGSIIPTMPVMNYTHEKPVYPLIFEVFPAPKGEEASFTLYEDEGEDLGYQRDEFAKTPVRFRTEEGGYLLSVGAREGKGYAVPAPRNFIFRMYLKTAPKGVTVQGKKVKKVKPERLEENPDDDTESMVWSWDKATGICSLRMPDRGEESRISLRL